MTDQATAAPGAGSAPQGSASGGGHPAFNNPITRPVSPPPDGAHNAIDRTRGRQSEENPRSRGYRPAPDWRQEQPRETEQGAPDRQQQPGAEPQAIRIGDVDYTAEQVNEALRFKSEQDIRKGGLPTSPDGYEIKLPANFKAPEGVNFQFDANSAELQNFRRLAHARGLDQDTFSEALGIYAANRISEQQTLGTARNAERAKLGSAADQRIAAVETWLKSQVGAKANLIVAQLKNFPVAGMVEMFEQLARNASSQGSADYSQSGRHYEDNAGKIEGYANMNYSQRRAAQDAQARRGGR